MQRLALAVAVLLVLPAAAAVAAEPVAVCGHTTSQPALEQGATGAAVTEAQCELNLATKASRYTPIGADGSFGPATDARVRVFQKCAAPSVDGRIGPNTWAALNSWSARPRKRATQGTSGTAQGLVCGLSAARPTPQSGSTGTDVEERQCRLNLAMEPGHCSGHDRGPRHEGGITHVGEVTIRRSRRFEALGEPSSRGAPGNRMVCPPPTWRALNRSNQPPGGRASLAPRRSARPSGSAPRRLSGEFSRVYTSVSPWFPSALEALPDRIDVHRPRLSAGKAMR